MKEETVSDAQWHLDHSQPSQFLKYFDPEKGFSLQIETLVTRFRDIVSLCTPEDPDAPLLHLRDALAFHLVKMSRWWGFEFCPRALTGIRGPVFMSWLKAHVARNLEDEMLLDVFTLQKHTKAGSKAQVLILGLDKTPCGCASFAYGVDGQRLFRYSSLIHNGQITWCDEQYPDFASAWLAARSTHASTRPVYASAGAQFRAGLEHTWARSWYQRHFYRLDERTAVTFYEQACVQSSLCQTIFGQNAFKAITGGLALQIIERASERHVSVASILNENGRMTNNASSANTIIQQARDYIHTCIDVSQRPSRNDAINRASVSGHRRCC